MAITPAQRALRAALARCATPDEVRALVAPLWDTVAASWWPSIIKATPIFDDALIASYVERAPNAWDYLGRHPRLTRAQRDALYERLVSTIPFSAGVIGILRAAAARRRLTFASPAVQRLLSHARAVPAGESVSPGWVDVWDVMNRVVDTPVVVKVELWVHAAYSQARGPNVFVGPQFEPEVFPVIVRALAQHHPAACGWWLKDMSDEWWERLRGLTASEVAPLLASDAQDARLAGLRLAAFMEGAAP